MQKKYIVLGSNNFWYALLNTKKEAKEFVKNFLKLDESFADPESGYSPEAPEDFYIYEAKEI